MVSDERLNQLIAAHQLWGATATIEESAGYHRDDADALTELLAARARIAELEADNKVLRQQIESSQNSLHKVEKSYRALEAAEKRDVADEAEAVADWKADRERMEGEIRGLREAAEHAVKLIDRACIVSRHKAIMGRVTAAAETLRAALGKT